MKMGMFNKKMTYTAMYVIKAFGVVNPIYLIYVNPSGGPKSRMAGFFRQKV